MKMKLSVERALLQVSILDDTLPAPPPPTDRPAIPGVRSTAERRAKARAIQAAGKRRWIDAGKPIALEVAKRDGRVTADTFRTAAADFNKLPPTYGEQRALSYIPLVFSELVRAGRLQKLTRDDGSVVKEYCSENGNSHVVYILAEPAAEVRCG